jgi:hypothetical protein
MWWKNNRRGATRRGVARFGVRNASGENERLKISKSVSMGSDTRKLELRYGCMATETKNDKINLCSSRCHVPSESRGGSCKFSSHHFSESNDACLCLKERVNESLEGSGRSIISEEVRGVEISKILFTYDRNRRKAR